MLEEKLNCVGGKASNKLVGGIVRIYKLYSRDKYLEIEAEGEWFVFGNVDLQIV